MKLEAPLRILGVRIFLAWALALSRGQGAWPRPTSRREVQLFALLSSDRRAALEDERRQGLVTLIDDTSKQTKSLAAHLAGHVPHPAHDQAKVITLLGSIRGAVMRNRQPPAGAKVRVQVRRLFALADALEEPPLEQIPPALLLGVTREQGRDKGEARADPGRVAGVIKSVRAFDAESVAMLSEGRPPLHPSRGGPAARKGQHGGRLPTRRSKRERAGARPGWVYAKDAVREYGLPRTTLGRFAMALAKQRKAEQDEGSCELIIERSALEAELRRRGRMPL